MARKPTQTDAEKERNRGGTGKGKGNGGGRGDYGERVGPGEHEGDEPVRIHEEYVQRHLGGGGPATTEAYGRALKQFRRLPGAVQFPPTQVELRRPESEPDNDEPDERQ